MLMKLTKEKTLTGTFLYQLNVESTGYVVTTIYQISVTWVGRLLSNGDQVLDYVEADKVASAEEFSVDGLGPRQCNLQWSPDQTTHELRAIQIFNERRSKDSRLAATIKQRAADALALQVREIEARRSAARGVPHRELAVA